MKSYTYIDKQGKNFSYTMYGEDNKHHDVDILMLAYNHENYIAQAIESVLMQETEYSYRIIIGEDCSTDLTRDIVMKYYKKYPQKITLVLWNQNVGGVTNSRIVYRASDAEFVAMLEGDDYWTSPLKLERQISFLKKNKDFIGTGHNVRCVDIEGNLLHRDFALYPICDEHVYGEENAKRFELAAQTASMVYRNFWKSMSEEQVEQYCLCQANGDIKISILLGLNGKVLFMKDIMADHRRIFKGDSWTAQTANKNMYWELYKSNRNILKYMRENMNVELHSLKEGYIWMSFMQFMETLKLRDFVVFLKIRILG